MKTYRYCGSFFGKTFAKRKFVRNRKLPEKFLKNENFSKTQFSEILQKVTVAYFLLLAKMK
jgi:hypothetical protein